MTGQKPPFQRETKLEAASCIINYLTGGSLKELYCVRLIREERWAQVERINWLWYCMFGEFMHCQRVAKGESK